MRNKEYFDESQIRKTIEVLKPDGELFEIRIIGKAGNRKRIISGYFTDAETLISAFDTIDPRGTNIYITLNRVKRDCYAREQHDCFRQTDSTTHDHEVEAYEWLFIDMDPIRIADVSSTDEELGLATKMARDVATYMDSIGFSQPVEALSGNGAHLLYRIDCPADDVHKALIGKCLKALADKFNTDRVKIDEVNLNQSRICKLYGTWAQKGANTQERPYRLSEIVSAPNEIEINSTNLLEILADDFTEVAQPCQERGAFDIEQFMSEHGLTYSDKKNDFRSVIYPLDTCPFDSSHTNGDAKIFAYPDGAVAFKCHHNSCRQYKWQDVRLMFEPDAYTKDEETEKRIEEGWQKHKALQPVVIVKKSEDIEEIKQNIPKLLPISALDLQQKKFDKTYYAVEGLIPEGETVIAAPPKTGKSWLMLDMCLKISEGEKFLDFQTTKSDTLYLALE
ncbi:MAG: AAA family ATPase, partial [Pseudobutyrivibrio sp.]|nr:AAA family ATPase [Pseudobutyrivibrio sp.]